MMNKNYWNNVFNARKAIYDMMLENGVSSVRSSDPVNPCYNQITENGGIGLELYYGMPSKLYTPLGYINITNNYICGGDKKAITQRLIEDYGAVIVIEEETSFMGLFGPVYSITKLPWTDDELPVFEFKKRSDYIEYYEAKKIYAQVTDTYTFL